MRRLAVLIPVVSGLLLFGSQAAARDELPPKTEDGLVLEKNTKVAAVYIKPGASLEGFDKVLLVDALVAFEKDWQRDYNRDQVSLTMRVSDKDMDRIKTEVAAEFRKVFTEALQNGGYPVVTEPGQDVMILRPAIVNLRVNAPDVNAPGVRAMIVSSAGSMTLYAELYDSVTSDKFAQIIDAQEAGDRAFGYSANRVTNRQALDQVLRHWADLMVKALDHANGKDG